LLNQRRFKYSICRVRWFSLKH